MFETSLWLPFSRSFHPLRQISPFSSNVTICFCEFCSYFIFSPRDILIWSDLLCRSNQTSILVVSLHEFIFYWNILIIQFLYRLNRSCFFTPVLFHICKSSPTFLPNLIVLFCLNSFHELSLFCTSFLIVNFKICTTLVVSFDCRFQCTRSFLLLEVSSFCFNPIPSVYIFWRSYLRSLLFSTFYFLFVSIQSFKSIFFDTCVQLLHIFFPLGKSSLFHLNLLSVLFKSFTSLFTSL